MFAQPIGLTLLLPSALQLMPMLLLLLLLLILHL
jgi:hypothetical protein